jgi:hypothetical protein
MAHIVHIRRHAEELGHQGQTGHPGINRPLRPQRGIVRPRLIRVVGMLNNAGRRRGIDHSLFFIAP